MHAEFRVTEKGLCIYANDGAIITGIGGFIEYPGNHYDIIRIGCKGDWTATNNVAQCENMKVELSDFREGFLVRSVFTNTEEDTNSFGRFTAFAGNLSQTIEKGLVNRYTEANGNRVCEMQSQIDTVCTVYNAVYDSADNTAFLTEKGESFVFGAATNEKYFTGVTFSREGRITAHCNLEEHPVKHSASVRSEWFYFAPGMNCISALQDYAGAVASMAGVEPSKKENPSGFCTWYYYAHGITPETIRQNMAVLDEHKEDLPVKYIQIDDGWYDFWGIWQPNKKFVDMKAIADEIKAHGYLPGIWLAPFGSDGQLQFFKDHPDWFVRNRNGEIWQRPSLDFTNPEAREYIASVFRRLSYEWGFRYIKMDIITGTLAPGIHHDPDATALENYRIGLKTIRESVNPDTFLLGCTAPLTAACGLVDGMRISCDVFERWQSLRDVFNSVLKRFHLHRKYFLCDADCLIIRKKENEDEECFRLCTRNDEEIKTYLTAMAASGGILMLSDKLPNLTEAQLALISKLFPVTQDPAIPLDLMDSFIPGVLDFGVRGKARTVALINWGDVGREISVDAGPSFVREFWSGDIDLFSGGKFTSYIEPHCAKVFAFTPLSDKAVIGSDASLVMQSDWRAHDGGITGKRLKPGERLYISAKTSVVSAEGCEIAALPERDGYLFYEVTPSEEDYTVTF